MKSTMRRFSELGIQALSSGWTQSLHDPPAQLVELVNAKLVAGTCRCAMNFLFRPNQNVRNMFEKEFEAMNAPNTLKIGIQVR
jgi:hypothetical protein